MLSGAVAPRNAEDHALFVTNEVKDRSHILANCGSIKTRRLQCIPSQAFVVMRGRILMQ